MGASSVVDPSKVIDPSIGALVWVRRRNGWWWPGQIISEDELPEGCIQMPRSGTPVKLLGKEEAIVDWYNLEKSKRVKPFRCGEYTDCIEKAKASASNITKKRVKYARREDAILEALELERACLGKNQSAFVLNQENQEEEQCNIDGSHSSLQSGKVREHVGENITSKSDSGPELSQSGVSFEEPPNQIQTANKNSKQGNTPNDSEDDGNEGVKKRMKGLEDLGMCIASSPPKRKSSQISHAHELLKRKNKRRTLTKVLECTTMVSSQVDPDDLSGLNGSSVPGSSNGKVICPESNGLKRYSYLATNNSSDSTGVSCDNAILLPENLDHESSQSLFDVPLVAEEKCTTGSEDAHRTGQTTEKGTSEWQLKGKRNSRSRKNDETETNATLSKENDSLTCPSENSGSKPELASQSLPNAEIQAEPVSQRLLPCRSSRFTLNPKYDSSDFSVSHRTIGSGLYEVKVHVEATSQAQHAPLISLMSKVYNQPITGYPIDVEILEDGYCDNLITVSECYSSTSQLKYVSEFKNIDKGCERMPPRGTKPKAKKKTKKSNKSKKKNGEKIRKLSLISNKKPLVEKMKGPPLLACVPLKVVFSRINADLNSSIRCMK